MEAGATFWGRVFGLEAGAGGVRAWAGGGGRRAGPGIAETL